MDFDMQNDKLTVHLRQDIDHASVMVLRPCIEDLIQKHKPETLVMDVADVGFMDSAGIGFIIGRYKSMKRVGGELKIVNASSKIRKILNMACVERFVQIN